MKRKKLKIKFVFIFFITLSLVLLAGLSYIVAYEYITGEKGEESQFENTPGIAAEEVIVKESIAERNGLQIQDTQIPDGPQAQGGPQIPDGPQAQGGPQVLDEPPAQDEPSSRYKEILNDNIYMAENRIYTKEPAVPGEVKLCFAGDILFDDAYAVMAVARQRGGTAEQAFSADLLEKMRSADVMMVNNEFPYTERGTAIEEKQYTFRARSESAAWLGDMGVDIISLANNHTFDFGEIGLLDTLEILKNIGMPYVGAGQDLQEASAPVYFIIGDLKIAFIAATQIERQSNPDTRGATDALSGVFRCWNPEKLYAAVAEAKENSDFVVVYIHWGTENVSQPDWAQIEQAPKIAQAGADLIVGAHPHCLQGITYYGNVPVIYSLGNFWFSSREVDTGILEVVLDAQGIRTVRFLPALQKNCVTAVLYGDEKERVLGLMRELSPRVRIDGEGFVIGNS